jgi:hypothetical protein
MTSHNDSLNNTLNIDPNNPDAQNPEAQVIQNSFFGTHFTSRAGEQTAEVIQDFPIICLYFAARNSPPCRIFNPVLLNFYREVNMIKNLFEIIYVPRDSSEDGFLSFL